MTIRPISDLAGKELTWSQPSATERKYELRDGTDLVATLRFERGTLATAEASTGQWTFKREGFWHPQVTVRLPNDAANIAVFRAHTGGVGDLTFSDGREFRLTSTNAQSEWMWQQDDKVLVHSSGRRGAIKANGSVTVDPAAAGLADVGLLVVIGWYLVVLHAQDTAVAANAAVVASRVAVR